MALFPGFRVQVILVASLVGWSLRSTSLDPNFEKIETIRACTDSIVLESDFPNFPFGERHITLEWVCAYFGIEETQVAFKKRDLGGGYSNIVFQLQVGESSVTFGKGRSESKYFGLEHAEILDSRIGLAGGIRVGITKQEFLKSISMTYTTFNCDRLMLLDDEFQTGHEFLFRADTLYEIRLKFID